MSLFDDDEDVLLAGGCQETSGGDLPLKCPDAELLTGFAGQRIRNTARRLSFRWGLSRHEEDDLAQELRLHLLRVWPQFDPNRAPWPRFASMVIARRALTITAAWRRNRARHPNLDSDNSTLVTAEHLPCQQGRSARSAEELAALREDLSRVIEDLPPELQAICQGLTTHAVAELARQFCVPRRTMRDQIRKVREIFSDHGLEAYF